MAAQEGTKHPKKMQANTDRYEQITHVKTTCEDCKETIEYELPAYKPETKRNANKINRERVLAVFKEQPTKPIDILSTKTQKLFGGPHKKTIAKWITKAVQENDLLQIENPQKQLLSEDPDKHLYEEIPETVCLNRSKYPDAKTKCKCDDSATANEWFYHRVSTEIELQRAKIQRNKETQQQMYTKRQLDNQAIEAQREALTIQYARHRQQEQISRQKRSELLQQLMKYYPTACQKCSQIVKDLKKCTEELDQRRH